MDKEDPFCGWLQHPAENKCILSPFQSKIQLGLSESYDDKMSHAGAGGALCTGSASVPPGASPRNTCTHADGTS